jgi:hypothetical protein
MLSGCCSDPGVLQGSWVLVARGSSAAGIASVPERGGPLTVLPARDVVGECFSSQTLDAHFGAQCNDHESEGGAPPVVTDTLPLGPEPTPGEVRWYCDRRTVLRLLLARCEGTDTFRVSEVDVARR